MKPQVISCALTLTISELAEPPIGLFIYAVLFTLGLRAFTACTTLRVRAMRHP
jgi:hypothetical protein